MLGRLFETDDRPLTEERPPEKRLLGCCRDFTVLLVAVARHEGIPARARVGFAAYFIDGYNVDHEVAEVWDAGEGRWRLVRDLAALNKAEMVLWDHWGLTEREPQSEKDVALLDKVAEAALSPDTSFAKVRALYERSQSCGCPPRSRATARRPSLTP